MDKAPKIGTRVLVRSGYSDRENVTGVVERIHKKRTYRHDFDWSDDNMTDADVLAAETGYASEREWKVTVRVDARPAWWPYGDSLTFCPNVSRLTPL
jgi:hypothetical protein